MRSWLFVRKGEEALCNCIPVVAGTVVVTVICVRRSRVIVDVIVKNLIVVVVTAVCGNDRRRSHDRSL